MNHKLSNIDVKTKTGNCAKCGLVKLKHKGLRPNGVIHWSCTKKENELNAKRRKINNPNYAASVRRFRWMEKRNQKGLNEDIAYIINRHDNCKACECCGKDLSEIKALHLDHCHLTNKFRGFLCHQCNVGLGMFGDSVEKLHKAINYLELFNKTRNAPLD